MSRARKDFLKGRKSAGFPFWGRFTLNLMIEILKKACYTDIDGQFLSLKPSLKKIESGFALKKIAKKAVTKRKRSEVVIQEITAKKFKTRKKFSVK